MKICKECGKEFSPQDDRVKYCSADCRLNHEKKKVAEYRRKYYAENKEKITERNRKYRAENKEKVAERVRKYKAANKEKIAERQRKYYLKKIWGDED